MQRSEVSFVEKRPLKSAEVFRVEGRHYSNRSSTENASESVGLHKTNNQFTVALDHE